MISVEHWFNTTQYTLTSCRIGGKQVVGAARKGICNLDKNFPQVGGLYSWIWTSISP